MKVRSEYRDLGVDELRQREKDLKTIRYFALRSRNRIGQVEAGYKLKSLRRDLARVKTVLRERRRCRPWPRRQSSLALSSATRCTRP